jgi:hypothetical protein
MGAIAVFAQDGVYEERNKTEQGNKERKSFEVAYFCFIRQE